MKFRNKYGDRRDIPQLFDPKRETNRAWEVAPSLSLRLLQRQGGDFDFP